MNAYGFGHDNKEEISVIQGYQSDASVFKTFKEPEFLVQNFAEDGNTALVPAVQENTSPKSAAGR